MNISRHIGSRMAGLISGLALALTITAADARPQPDGSRTSIKKIVVEEALNSNVPPSLALAVAKVESDFQAHVESSKGARGVMQIMPSTGRSEWGVDPDELWDPRLNVRLGIDYLEHLIDRYDGNWEFALSFYNGGSKVGKPGQARVLPWTRKYVNNVLRWEKRYAAQENIWMALVDREDRVYGKKRSRKNWTQVADNRDWPQADDNRIAEFGVTEEEMAALHVGEDGRYTRTLRPKVKWKWTNKRKQARRAKRSKRYNKRHNRDDFRSIEKRRQAIRGSLDDFS